MQTTHTQFKPGHKPWNTGLAGFLAGGRSSLTHFVKGRQPTNTKELGSYRLVKSKTGTKSLEQKMSHTPGHNHKRWVPVARLVWEAVHGPVVSSSFIVFKAGQQTSVLQDITIDRLQCLTRAENARCNIRYNKPAKPDKTKSAIHPSLVPTLLKLRAIGISYQKIATTIGVSYASVHRAINAVNQEVTT